MAKRKSDEGANENQPKKGHKCKWSREDRGGDQEFLDKACTPKKRSASTSAVVNLLDSTPVKLHQPPNNPHSEIATPKRRGRKPGTKMEPKAKESDNTGCQCFTKLPPHESSYRCQVEAKFPEYCIISSRYVDFSTSFAYFRVANWPLRSIISTSDMITVFVGPENETFAVHKDLLKLHSGLIREYTSNGDGDNNHDDGKLRLPTIKPAMFADFVSWVYNGSYLQDDPQANKEEEDACTQLWAMGSLLKVDVLILMKACP